MSALKSAILMVPLDLFKRRIQRFSLSELKDLVREIKEIKWTARDSLSDNQIVDIERKESSCIYLITQMVNLKNDKDRDDYTRWMKSINFKKKVY